MSETSAGLALPDEVVERVNNAFTSGLPMLVAYVNGDAQARLSFRGSMHAHSADQLAFAARDPEGGLSNALQANNKVTVMYRDPQRARRSSSTAVPPSPAMTRPVTAATTRAPRPSAMLTPRRRATAS